MDNEDGGLFAEDMSVCKIWKIKFENRNQGVRMYLRESKQFIRCAQLFLPGDVGSE